MPQVRKDTTFFIVNKKGTPHRTVGMARTMMSFEGIINAVKGGMDLDEVEIFDDEDSARLASVANYRRAQVERFDTEDVLRASSLVLFDRDGVVLSTIDFMPVEHTPVE